MVEKRKRANNQSYSDSLKSQFIGYLDSFINQDDQLIVIATKNTPQDATPVMSYCTTPESFSNCFGTANVSEYSFHYKFIQIRLILNEIFIGIVG